jgi:hypothetical protein
VKEFAKKVTTATLIERKAQLIAVRNQLPTTYALFTTSDLDQKVTPTGVPI